MSTKLQDGTGKGYTQKVDSDNRAWVNSVSTQSEENASRSGLSYNINTGIITLTNATKTPVLYVRNNEEYDLIISAFIFQTGASTGGSGNILVDLIRNPTTGTIVSNATAVEMNVNRNFGSTRAFSANVYKGATGSTMTDGSKFIESILPTATQRVVISVGAIVIPKGSSIGLNITPPAGNTSMAVEFAFSGFLNTEL